MPRRGNSAPAPEAMTLRKAMPVLALSAVFDLIRFFFEQFWFFGPALVAGYCTSEFGASAAAGATCTAIAGGVGFYGAAILAYTGALMAMVTGFAGWMIVSLVVVTTNVRLLRENARAGITSMLGLGVSLIPFVGSLPALTTTTWHLYHTQIKHDKKKLREWQAAEAEKARRENQLRYEQLASAQMLAEEQALEDAFIEDRLAEEAAAEIPEDEFDQAAQAA